MNNAKHLRVGSDPRTLPDYAALRDEMMKLSHPARPDVDWKYAETLCLRLFEHNGVELQTAAWYTLVHSHTAGLTGMNEGLALTDVLLARHWSVMWPVNTHARVEIITGLIQRLLKVFRTLALNHRDDLPLLYQSEHCLMDLLATLARHEIKQISRMDVLLQQVRQAITRLENGLHAEHAEPAVVLPPQALVLPETVKISLPETVAYAAPTIAVQQPNPQPKSTPKALANLAAKQTVSPQPASASGSERLEPEPESVREQQTAAPRRVMTFIAGMCTALLMSALAFWGWHQLYFSSPQSVALAPLPEALSAEQLSAVRQSLTVEQADNWLEQSEAQLKWLMAQPPGWSLQYGQTLLSQAHTLWPDRPIIAEMQHEWRQHLEANALPAQALNGWHDGMEKLQQLADRLNGLDEKRGKYMTVSELKSEVFATMQAFNHNPPVEEQLRQLTAIRTANMPAAALQAQAELHLKQLLSHYALLTQAELTPLSDKTH
ncbi:VasL domain-containing protein [Serratia sp. NPDC078593]|uniref:VasL domain-containing protein n=1 Tax=unclassified Serratia (in: enterobacteria) TaxID=2647522 RepID=UPI0037D96EB9